MSDLRLPDSARSPSAPGPEPAEDVLPPGACFEICAERRSDGSLVLRPRGDLDHETRDAVLSALHANYQGGGIEFDMGGVDFVDSSGVRVMIAAYLLAGHDGQIVTLSNPNRQFVKLLELCGLTERFAIRI